MQETAQVQGAKLSSLSGAPVRKALPPDIRFAFEIAKLIRIVRVLFNEPPDALVSPAFWPAELRPSGGGGMKWQLWFIW